MKSAVFEETKLQRQQSWQVCIPTVDHWNE